MMPAHITTHAVRRYAERAMGMVVDESVSDVVSIDVLRGEGVDVDGIYRRLRQVCDQAVDLGAIAVRVDNVRIMLRENTVVTVLPKRAKDYQQGDNSYVR